MVGVASEILCFFKQYLEIDHSHSKTQVVHSFGRHLITVFTVYAGFGPLSARLVVGERSTWVALFCCQFLLYSFNV